MLSFIRLSRECISDLVFNLSQIRSLLISIKYKCDEIELIYIIYVFGE